MDQQAALTAPDPSVLTSQAEIFEDAIISVFSELPHVVFIMANNDAEGLQVSLVVNDYSASAIEQITDLELAIYQRFPHMAFVFDILIDHGWAPHEIYSSARVLYTRPHA
jgi:hypothetical protein